MWYTRRFGSWLYHCVTVFGCHSSARASFYNSERNVAIGEVSRKIESAHRQLWFCSKQRQEVSIWKLQTGQELRQSPIHLVPRFFPVVKRPDHEDINFRRSSTDINTTIKDRDSSVGIVTRYGLDVPGIESRSWRDFPHPSRGALEPTQPLIQWVQGLFRG